MSIKMCESIGKMVIIDNKTSITYKVYDICSHFLNMAKAVLISLPFSIYLLQIVRKMPELYRASA